MTPQIDHIIVKVPYADLENPPEWLEKNFTISPGGRHADNKTENRLIVFKDGSYIELIAFVDDSEELSKGHYWGPQGYGVVDWALTSSGPENVKQIDKRIQEADSGLGLKYADPKEGGRKRPDGEELRWVVIFPENVKRGEAPFWCLDLTPRELRVPKGEIATTHPCGALGVGSLTLAAPESRFESFKKAYAALFGTPGTSSSFGTLWEIDAPIRDVLLQKPSVTVETAEDPELSHAFISDITLLTDTVGLGQSRTTLAEKLGDKDVFINFVHGRSR